MLRKPIGTLAFGAVLYVPFVTATLLGQSSTANLSVTANVVKNCTISTAPVNFGSYDPVTTNATNPLDGSGTITVTCTKGASAHVGLADGNYSSGGNQRRMRTSATEYLEYDLYQDTSRTTPWGNTVGTNKDLGAAPDKNPRTFTVYGRVKGGQDAIVGSYSDSVVATVNF